ncbi:hypothetical protein FPV67DRAFT_1162748 [Lyophyllum atratum]|nr:hypothetical protein FPV67DRAFT_1162748 [Lyophyllum atratum]
MSSASLGTLLLLRAARYVAIRGLISASCPEMPCAGRIKISIPMSCHPVRTVTHMNLRAAFIEEWRIGRGRVYSRAFKG